MISHKNQKETLLTLKYQRYKNKISQIIHIPTTIVEHVVQWDMQSFSKHARTMKIQDDYCTWNS